MADPARHIATYDDLLALPDTVVGEILYGTLYTSPRPAAPHANASTNLGWALTGPFRFGKDGPGGWIILDEPELHLTGGHIVVPDLAGWRRERMPRLPKEAKAFELAPDWICEVLSPSTEAIDRSDKLPIYADAGVAHAWLLDPIVMTLEILRREGERWSLLHTFHGDAKVRAEPFDAIELDLSVLWAD